MAEHGGAAKRRRERRPRAYLRYARMSVVMARPRATTTQPHKDRRWPGPGGRFELQPELFELFHEELGGARPDRLAGVRPQERVQRHTVEHVVETFVSVPVLRAPVPLMFEQLVDVLALLEKQEREEEAGMDRIEDLILEGAPVSAAHRATWRRWASGAKRKRKKRRKKSFQRPPPVGAPVVLQLEFQQVKVEKVMGPQVRFLG